LISSVVVEPQRMSSLSVREFAAIGLDERIPESAKVVGNAIPVQSVITGRRQQKFLPVNGSTFQPSQNPNFRMSATSDFIIPSTATLHFKLVNKTKTAAGADSETSCFDDPPALAVLQRSQLRASGVLVEDILETNRASAALTYTHMEPERYAKQGSIDTKNWKWNRDFGTEVIGNLPDASSNYVQGELQDVRDLVNGLRLDEYGVLERQELASGLYDASQGNEIEINLPLSYVFGLFRTNRVFPLSFVGELNIEFTLAQAVAAIVSNVDTDVADYEIRDTYIVCDMAQLSDDYLKVLSQAFSSPDPGMAYNLPVDTLTNITQNKPISNSSQVNSYVFSKSTPFLKSILFTTQDNTARTSIDEYATSGMPNFLDATNSQVRLFVGSEVYPQYSVLDSPEEVFRNNMIALGTQGNVRAQYGLASNENFKNATTAGGINYILFSFSKVHGLGSDYYEMDSMDASLLGAVLDLQMNQVNPAIVPPATGSCSTLAIIEHTRVCRIGGGRFEVKA